MTAKKEVSYVELHRNKLIEVLMCCGDPPAGGVVLATEKLSYPESLAIVARNLRFAVDDYNQDHLSYEETYIEAAYRLIETSPKLIREWFGR